MPWEPALTDEQQEVFAALIAKTEAGEIAWEPGPPDGAPKLGNGISACRTDTCWIIRDFESKYVGIYVDDTLVALSRHNEAAPAKLFQLALGAYTEDEATSDGQRKARALAALRTTLGL